MHRLDNVIWEALTTRLAEFAEGRGMVRRFVPEISPLAALREPSPEAYASLADLIPDQGTVGLFLDEVHRDCSGWNQIAGAPLLQMIYEHGDRSGPSDASGSDLIELTAADSVEMVELAALTKPGPFNLRTRELGTYVGIRRDGKLVAMAGERLRVPAHTEVSAVCAHPDHIGHGYARVLMSEVMRRIRRRGETPFLHVREDNQRATALYERLGFQISKRWHYAVLRKDSLG